MAAELRALGLRVDLMAHPSVLAPAGQVTGVSPSGTLRPGDLVTVAYATEPDLEPAAPAPVEQATTAETAALGCLGAALWIGPRRKD